MTFSDLAEYREKDMTENNKDLKEYEAKEGNVNEKDLAVYEKSDRTNTETEDNDREGFQSRISRHNSSFSKTQRRIAAYFEEHEQEVLKYSITMLAQKIGTSPAAISRFCQVLHYKGFSDMKFSLAKRLAYTPSSTPAISLEDDLTTIKKNFLQLYQRALTDTLMNIDEKYITMAAREIIHANHVYIYSSGNSGISASSMYQLLMQIEIPCNFFTERQLAYMSVSQLKKGDVAIAINYSGASSSLLELLTMAKQNKVTTIAITSNSQAYLGRAADYALCYSLLVQDDLRYIHVARMCELAIIGLLQTEIIHLASRTNTDYLKYTKIAIEKSRMK